VKCSESHPITRHENRRRGTGIAIVILNHGFIKGGGEVVIAKIRPLYPREKPRAGLNGAE